jgi:glutamate---cysteine ligase / carboxylate-amine ligase
MADLSAAALRERFDGVTDHTVGVEEELMLLDPDTLDLLPAAARVHSELGGRVSLRTELPAAQVETASPVCDSIEAATWSLSDGRRQLGAGVEGWARLAGSGTHPFAAPEGALRDDPKYDELKAAFPWALPRQLVFGLHIHVAVRGADRALAVLNAVRSYLPDLAALAGNAPLHAGRDTGLASVRPEISGLLPRQGVPPAFSSWEAYADYLAWGRRGGLFPDEGEPWWEARGHDELGTIELRVPDAQTTADEAAGVLAVGAGLIAWLAERYDAGEPLPVHDTIRIAENRWRALRHGLAGALLDLDSGEPQPARARVLELIERVAPAAERLGGATALAHARTLADRNGAERQRALAAERDPHGVVECLADAFLP